MTNQVLIDKIHPCVETVTILEASRKLTSGEKENREEQSKLKFLRGEKT